MENEKIEEAAGAEGDDHLAFPLDGGIDGPVGDEVRKGGAAMGKSPMMPPWSPTLKDGDIEDVDSADVDTIGPAIENHPAFPAKTNVEFAQLMDDDRIRLRVWERGCAETLACGTGACATLVVASLTCRVGREATVELPGGELAIRWAEDNHVYMTGPATEVFSGEWPD